MRRQTRWFVLAAVVALAGCHRKPAPSAGSEYPTESGIASWYGVPFNGRLTASGEVYDMEKMTAAHKTLPFGSRVRVVLLRNNRTVEVRITDRGPFKPGRIIDLSHAAAQTIDMPGIGDVRLEILEKPVTRGPENYAVQVGEFTDREAADRARADLERRFGYAQLVFRDGDKTWRVLVGTEPSIEGAERLATQLQNEPGGAYVVRLDSPQ